MFRNISNQRIILFHQLDLQMDSFNLSVLYQIKILIHEMMITFKFLKQSLKLLFLLVKFKLDFKAESGIMKRLCIKFGFFLLLPKIFNQDKSTIFLTSWELLEVFSTFYNLFFQYFWLKYHIIVSFYKRSPVSIYLSNLKIKFLFKIQQIRIMNKIKKKSNLEC